eukprot:712955-Rhodomonas_salina.1
MDESSASSMSEPPIPLLNHTSPQPIATSANERVREAIADAWNSQTGELDQELEERRPTQADSTKVLE